MRSGERWFYEVSKILYNEFGKESFYYRGFNKTVNGDTVAIFEAVDSSINLSEFANKYWDYKNEDLRIRGITVEKELKINSSIRFVNCVVVWL